MTGSRVIAGSADGPPSRGILRVGHEPTLAAGLVLVVLDRVLALIGLRSRRIERLLEGDSLVVYRDGQLQRAAMARAGISEHDIQEAARLQLNAESLAEVRCVLVESTGEISVLAA